MIQGIHATGGTTSLPGLPACDNIGKRNEMSFTGVQNLPPCNHNKVDTHIMYHRTLEDKPTAVIASDTGILIIMVNVYASHLTDHDWFSTDQEKPVCECSKIQRFMISLVMQLQSSCDQCSSSPALI